MEFVEGGELFEENFWNLIEMKYSNKECSGRKLSLNLMLEIVIKPLLQAIEFSMIVILT